MNNGGATVKSRLGVKAQVGMPGATREALGLKPRDELAFVIRGDEVKVARVPATGEAPFGCFTEWASDSDRKGYAEL